MVEISRLDVDQSFRQCGDSLFAGFENRRKVLGGNIRAFNASINGHPVENHSSGLTVSSRVGVNNHSESDCLTVCFVGKRLQPSLFWISHFIKGVMTNHFANWPQPWSQSLALTKPDVYPHWMAAE